MVFSSLRQRYNNLKDSPDHQKVAGTHIVPDITTEAAKDDIPTERIDSHLKRQDQSPPSPNLTAKDEGKESVTGITTETSGDDFADDDPAIKDIPWTVRRIVSLHDDPTLPTLTFRYFVLTLLFVIPGAFLSQMSHYRTTSAPYSVLFVQIASNYAGLGLAKILPAAFVRLPFTKYGFNLNPGPWSIKEHVLVTISAASGARYNMA